MMSKLRVAVTEAKIKSAVDNDKFQSSRMCCLRNDSRDRHQQPLVDIPITNVPPPRPCGVEGAFERFQREKEERRQEIRAKLPLMSVEDCRRAHLPNKHIVCTELLEKGFTKSFMELFRLLKLSRERINTESKVKENQLLENQADKLRVIADCLMAAEQADIVGDYKTVFRQYSELALYFQSPEDRWVADHFYVGCLNAAATIKNETDRDRILADARQKLGISAIERKDLTGALTHLSVYYKLTQNKDWTIDDNAALPTLHSDACIQLVKAYTGLAEETTDRAIGLEYQLKAYSMARESGDQDLFTEQKLQLALAYSRNHKPDISIQHLEDYLNNCTQIQDVGGMGKAYHALAECYQSQGKLEKSLEYFNMLMDVAVSMDNSKAINRARKDISAHYNKFGIYEKSIDYANQARDSSMNDDTSMVETTSVLAGIATAHINLYRFTHHIENNQLKGVMDRILTWKDQRSNLFDDLPLPRSGVASRPISRELSLMQANIVRKLMRKSSIPMKRNSIWTAVLAPMNNRDGKLESKLESKLERKSESRKSETS